MDGRWQPLKKDSKREVRIILHPTAALWDVRRGLDPASDDSVDLTPYVNTVTQTAFDLTVTCKFNRELFGWSQPRPNQVIELQLKQKELWQPLWIGIVDAVNQFTLSRGERSLQLIAKTREQQDIWKNVKRMTPLFPQMTNLTYIATRIARQADMKGDEVLLPPSSMSTSHTNTQLADMNAWDMINAVFVPLGWTPFIDCLGRLRAADRSLQSRASDIKLPDEGLIKIVGSRQRPPKSRVRVAWLNPTLKKHVLQGKMIQSRTITLGWFLPYWKETVDYSDDKSLRVERTRLETIKNINRFAGKGFITVKWTAKGDLKGELFFKNWNFAIMIPLMLAWVAAHATPDTTLGITPGPGLIVDSPGSIGVTVPVGRKVEGIAMAIFMTLMLNMGTGQYEIWGYPYEYVHARNLSEAFDASVPTYVDNVEDIESDFVANEEHAKTIAIRELIYLARAANKWTATIVDDPRIEYGDILTFPDGNQLYVEDFSRQLERGAEAILNVSGFLVGPAQGAGGTLSVALPMLAGSRYFTGGGFGGGYKTYPPGTPIGPPGTGQPPPGTPINPVNPAPPGYTGPWHQVPGDGLPVKPPTGGYPGGPPIYTQPPPTPPKPPIGTPTPPPGTVPPPGPPGGIGTNRPAIITADKDGIYSVVSGQKVHKLVRGFTAFTASQLWMAGNYSKIRDFCAWARSKVPSGEAPFLRVFLRWYNVGPYAPAPYITPADKIGPFARFILNEGCYPWMVYSTDQTNDQPSSFKESNWQSYIDRAIASYLDDDAQRVWHEIENEGWKNGKTTEKVRWNYSNLVVNTTSPPDGSPIASMVGGWRGNVGNIHTPRDGQADRKFKNLLEYGYQVDNLKINGRCVAGEPARYGEWEGIANGAGREVGEMVSRYYAGCDLFGGGGILHCDEFKNLRPKEHAITTAVSNYWRAGDGKIHIYAASRGSYSRGSRTGADEGRYCPFYHRDDIDPGGTALRTFCEEVDGTAYGLMVRPTVPYAVNPDMVGGAYRITGTWGNGLGRTARR